MAPVAPIERSSILILHGRYPHVENRTSGPFHGTPEDAIQHIFGATMGLAELQRADVMATFPKSRIL